METRRQGQAPGATVSNSSDAAGTAGPSSDREELRNRLWLSDTFVDFDPSLNKANNKLREALGDSAETPHFIETLAKRGHRFLGNLADNSRRIHSLLVLPLENLSRDPGKKFCRWTHRGTDYQTGKDQCPPHAFKNNWNALQGCTETLPEIARELQIKGVVEGTKLRSGDRVRVSAQLIHAPTDSHYRRRVTNTTSRPCSNCKRKWRLRLPRELSESDTSRTGPAG